MIIGIDASRANRDHKSGTEWYSYYLIRELAKIDPDNQYILYSDKPLKGGLADLSDDNHLAMVDVLPKYDLDGYQIIKSPYNNFKADILHWPFSNFWTLGRLTIEMILKKPELLFVPAHALPLVLPKKTINTIHDVSFKVKSNLYQKAQMGSEKKFFRNIIELFVRIFTWGKYGANSCDYLDWSTKNSLEKATKIIAISKETKREIERIYGNRGEQISVIHNGYNQKIYRPISDMKKQEEVLDKYGITAPFILNVGRLEKKKNTPLLIESFAKAKHFSKDIKEKLVLVGDASFGYDDVKYAIEEFELDDDVIMPGWVEEADMPFIFSAATAFIFPSRHEGFGIPIVQSFACGLPVVCSDIPVFREVAGEAALFCDSRDKDNLARAIEKIITDKNLRQSLSAKGLEIAKNYSWEECARRTLELIKSFDD